MAFHRVVGSGEQAATRYDTSHAALDTEAAMFYRAFLRVPVVGTPAEEDNINGYVAKRRGRYYAVI